MPAIAPEWDVQSPPTTMSLAPAPASSRPVATWVTRPGRYASRRSRFFIRGSGSGAQPGSLAASPWSRQVVAGQAGARREPVKQTAPSKLGGRTVHPAK